MILVTGGTGLVGSHLLYHLCLKNNKVRAIFRTKDSIKQVAKVFSYYTKDTCLFKKIEWLQADITDIVLLEKAFKNISYVYHAAALVSFNPKDYKLMREINIEGTANIVNLCIDKNIKKLCFISSISTIDKAVGAKFIDESGEWDKETSNYGYAITKYGAEMEVWRGTQEGVAAVIVNPGVILGAGFWKKSTGNFFDTIYNGLKFYSEGVTGFVDSNDVAKACLLLMNSKKANERYILVAENKSFKWLFYEIANNLGVKKPSIKVKKWMSSIAWRLEYVKCFFTRKKPLLTKNNAKSIYKKNYYSSEKIKKQLGLNFIPIKSSIKQICIFYLKDKKLL